MHEFFYVRPKKAIHNIWIVWPCDRISIHIAWYIINRLFLHYISVRAIQWFFPDPGNQYSVDGDRDQEWLNGYIGCPILLIRLHVVRYIHCGFRSVNMDLVHVVCLQNWLFIHGLRHPRKLLMSVWVTEPNLCIYI